MSTFGTMIAEIRGEIRRSGMDDDIKRAIGAAVLFHRDKRFKWNETSFSFATVADQPDYDETDDADIGRLAAFDSVKIASPEKKLIQRTLGFIRAKVAQSNGVPDDYAYYERSIILDPTPNTVYTVNVDAILELEDTTQAAGSQIITKDNILTIPNSYSTEWFGEGYELIKAWAKGYLSLHVLRNSEQSASMFSASEALRADQENQLGRLGGSSQVRPTRF